MHILVAASDQDSQISQAAMCWTRRNTFLTAYWPNSAGREGTILPRQPQEPSAPFEPVRPNPAVASKMRFGGPVQQGGGPAYPGVGMSGAPEVAPAPVEAFQPNKVNPNIARNLRFGGSVDAEGGPAYGRVGNVGRPVCTAYPPTAPPTVTPFQPNKVNPNISKTVEIYAVCGTQERMPMPVQRQRSGRARKNDAATQIAPLSAAERSPATGQRRKGKGDLCYFVVHTREACA